MCENCGWEDLRDRTDEMLEDEQFAFAKDTLAGINEWIMENHHCTDNQCQAVENIASSGLQ